MSKICENEYYYIDSTLSVKWDADIGTKKDNLRKKVGNYFKTKEEAVEVLMNLQMIMYEYF